MQPLSKHQETQEAVGGLALLGGSRIRVVSQKRRRWSLVCQLNRRYADTCSRQTAEADVSLAMIADGSSSIMSADWVIAALFIFRSSQLAFGITETLISRQVS